MSVSSYSAALQQTELGDKLQQARTHYEQRLAQLQAELATTRSLLSAYSSTLSQLTALSARFRPRYRVPFGPLAFFPHGHLTHPAEVLVLLGDGYFLQCTAERGREVCQRRMKLLRDKEDRCLAEERRVKERRDYGQIILGDDHSDQTDDAIVEIKEPYNEEEEEEKATGAGRLSGVVRGEVKADERAVAEVRARPGVGGEGMSEAEFNAYWDKLAELEAEEERREQQQQPKRARGAVAAAGTDVTRAEEEAEAEDEVALPAIHSPADIYAHIRARREQHGVSDAAAEAVAVAAQAQSAAAARRGKEKRVSFSERPSVAVIDPASTRPVRHHTHSPPPPASSFLPHSSHANEPPSPPTPPPQPAFSGAVRETAPSVSSTAPSTALPAPVPTRKLSRFLAERQGLQPEDEY